MTPNEALLLLLKAYSEDQILDFWNTLESLQEKYGNAELWIRKELMNIYNLTINEYVLLVKAYG